MPNRDLATEKRAIDKLVQARDLHRSCALSAREAAAVVTRIEDDLDVVPAAWIPIDDPEPALQPDEGDICLIYTRTGEVEIEVAYKQVGGRDLDYRRFRYRLPGQEALYWMPLPTPPDVAENIAKGPAILTKDEVAAMRREIDMWKNTPAPIKALPPRGREYWGVDRIVATSEHLLAERDVPEPS